MGGDDMDFSMVTLPLHPGNSNNFGGDVMVATAGGSEIHK